MDPSSRTDSAVTSASIITAAEQQSIEMFAELCADAVECDGIDARIDVRQDEAGNL